MVRYYAIESESCNSGNVTENWQPLSCWPCSEFDHAGEPTRSCRLARRQISFFDGAERRVIRPANQACRLQGFGQPPAPGMGRDWSFSASGLLENGSQLEGSGRVTC